MGLDLVIGERDLELSHDFVPHVREKLSLVL